MVGGFTRPPFEHFIGLLHKQLQTVLIFFSNACMHHIFGTLHFSQCNSAECQMLAQWWMLYGKTGRMKGFHMSGYVVSWCFCVEEVDWVYEKGDNLIISRPSAEKLQVIYDSLVCSASKSVQCLPVVQPLRSKRLFPLPSMLLVSVLSHMMSSAEHVFVFFIFFFIVRRVPLERENWIDSSALSVSEWLRIARSCLGQ